MSDYKELTPEGYKIAKSMGLTDSDIDSFWFRMGRMMVLKSREEALNPTDTEKGASK